MADTLPLRSPAPDAAVPSAGDGRPLAAFAPLLAAAAEAARLCGVSEATWWRLHAAGRTPAPVKLSHRTLWRIAELREWVDAGAPDRRTWDVLRAAKASGRPR